MSDLVGHPEYRFSRVAAQIYSLLQQVSSLQSRLLVDHFLAAACFQDMKAAHCYGLIVQINRYARLNSNQLIIFDIKHI